MAFSGELTNSDEETETQVSLQKQAAYVFSLTGFAAVSLFMLPPRLIFEGSFPTLIALQEVCAAGFGALYIVGMLTQKKMRRLRRKRSLLEDKPRAQRGSWRLTYGSRRHQRDTAIAGPVAVPVDADADHDAATDTDANGGGFGEWLRSVFSWATVEACVAHPYQLDHWLNILLQLGLATVLPIVCDIIAVGINGNADYHPLYFVGLLRLLHLLGFHAAFSALDSNLAVPHLFTFGLRNLLVLAFSTHVMACIFWLLARAYDFDPNDTWVGSQAPDLVTASAGTQYLYSLYWSAITASTVGYGDLSPVGEVEVALTIIFVVSNLWLLANIVGGISALAALEDTAIAEQRIMIRQFDRLLKDEHISDDIVTATREYLRLALHTARANVDSLPASVRGRIREERFGAVISALPLMQGLSPRFIASVIGRVQEDAFVAGLRILRKHDMPNRLCIIVDGTAAVQLVSSDSDLKQNSNVSFGPSQPKHVRRETVAILHPGAVFGAESFICSLGQPWAVLARTMLRVISLDETDRRELERCFPNDWHKLRSNLHASVAELREAAERQALAAAASRSRLTARPPDGDSTHSGSAYFSSYHAGPDAVPNPSAPGCNAFAPTASNAANLANAANSGADSTPAGAAFSAADPGAELTGAASLRGVAEHGKEVHKWQKLAAQHTWLEPASSLSTTAIVAFAEQARVVEEEIRRDASRAYQELSAIVCHHAGRGDDVELTRLLDLVPITNIPEDYDGRAGMHLAAAGGHNNVLRVLIRRGADVNIVDRFGRTPLIEAVLNGRDKTIALLRKHGAKLGLSQGEAASKLCDAALDGDLVLIRRYLAAGIDPNAGDYDRRTCLMVSAAEGHFGICKLMLERGADPRAKDRWGHTALDEALFFKHTGALCDLLEAACNAGADADGGTKAKDEADAHANANANANANAHADARTNTDADAIVAGDADDAPAAASLVLGAS